MRANVRVERPFSNALLDCAGGLRSMTCRNSTETANNQECQPPANGAAHKDTSEKASKTFGAEGREEKQFHGNVSQNPKNDGRDECSRGFGG